MRLRVLAVAVVLLAGCTSKEKRCQSLRQDVVLAKEARTKGDTPERRDRLDSAAREARKAGCDVSDLVGPNVGA